MPYFHVIHGREGWIVRREDDRIEGRFATQDEACRLARELVRREGGAYIVRGDARALDDALAADARVRGV